MARPVTSGRRFNRQASGQVRRSATAEIVCAQRAALTALKGGTVIYKQGGKLYMLQDKANEKASQHFEDQFDVDY